MSFYKKISIISALLVIFIGTTAGTAYSLLIPPKLEVPLRKDLIIANVNIVNPGEKISHNQTIVIRNGKIIEIRPSSANDSTSPDLKIPPGAICFPGLMDSHVHFPPVTAIGNFELFSLLYLYYGVTAVRDMGTIDGSIFKMRKKITEGEFPGPRIFTPGRILDGHPSLAPYARDLRSEEEAVMAVREQALAGADFIKTYSLLPLNILRVIEREAANQRLKVAGHNSLYVNFRDSNISDVQHYEEIFPYEYSDDRLQLINNKQKVWEKLTDDDINRIVRISAEQNIVHTPTLCNPSYRKYLSDVSSRKALEITKYLPRFWPEVVWNPAHSSYAVDADLSVKIDMFIEKSRRLTRKLFDAKIIIRAGTDVGMPFVVPGLSLHDEIQEYNALGIPADESLKTATVNGGSFFNELPGLGTIAAGAPADILVLRDNPVHSMDNLNKRYGVIADGRWYSDAYLSESVNKYQEHFRTGLYDGFTMFLAVILTKLYL